MFPAKGIGLLFIGLMGALVAWPALFSTLAPYDDEGYCMMTLRTFAEGERLYGSTHTQYGPAYYFLTSPIHEYLGWPLTQTGVRIKTLFLWCLAAVFVYLFLRQTQKQSEHQKLGTLDSAWDEKPKTSQGSSNVHRLINRSAIQRPIITRADRFHYAPVLSAVCVAFVVILHLDKLALEPGHPQELVLIGSLVSMLLLSTNLSPYSSRSHFRWLVAGVIAAVIGFTKLNCGMILASAMLSTAIVDSRLIPSSRWLAALLVAFPALLISWMGRSSLETVAWTLWIAVCASVALHRMADDFSSAEEQELSQEVKASSVTKRISIESWLWVAAGGAFTSFAMILGSLSTGISASELWFGMVGQHTDFGNDFLKPIPWDLGCMLGLLSVGLLFGAHSTKRFQRRSLVVVGGLVLACVAWTSCEPLLHGLKPRGAGSFLAWFLPGWLGFVYRCQKHDRFVVLLAILSPLMAYPVSGTQVAIGTTPGLILLGRAVSQMLDNARFANFEKVGSQLGSQLGLRIMTGVVCLFVVTSIAHWYRYLSFVPLDLPGTSGMRLSRSVVEQQRAIVEAVKLCETETLVFEGHNNNRFYFWTGTKPATSANPTFWPRMLNESERQKMQETLSRPGRYCVVRVPEYELFYDQRSQLLQDQLRKKWQKTSSIGQWDVGVIEVQDTNEPSQSH